MQRHLSGRIILSQKHLSSAKIMHASTFELKTPLFNTANTSVYE